MTKNLSINFSYRNVVIFTVIIFFATRVIDGVLRWFLANFGLYYLTYLPQLSIIFCITMSFCLLKLNRLSLNKIVVFLILAFGSIIAITYIRNLIQIFWGLYVSICFVFGLIAYKYVFSLENQKYIPRISLILLLIVMLGLVVDYSFDLPWVGFSFEMGGLSLEGSREWETSGLFGRRLAGFSRASFDTSGQLLVLLLLYIAFGQSLKLKILVYLLGGLGIYLTTTKTAIGIWAFFGVLFLLQKITPVKVQIIFRKIIPVVLFLIGFTLPVLSYYFSNEYNSNIFEVIVASRENDKDLKITNSFVMGRFIYIWPAAIENTITQGNILFGKGIGGIGTPLLYVNSDFYNPADNTYVHLFSLFGLSSFIFYPLWLKKIISMSAMRSKEEIYFYLFSLYALLNAISVGCEAQLIQFFMGMFIMYRNKFSMRKYEKL